jgi:release factor glutamine methyltransferase
MTAPTEEWTVGKLLTWTADYLRKQGADSPRLDAELLLAEARGCERIELYTAFHEVVPEETRAKFRESVRQRAQGKPVAYLLGQREFYSMAFQVTPDVLIPRPETEFVVLAMLDLLKPLMKVEDSLAIADIGTGSGILAVCAAKLVPNAQVTAVDISPAALAVARGNAEQHEVADRIDFREGDLLGPLETDAMFHLVMSNPPYVSEREYAELSREVRDYEPRQALLAGDTGTEVIARLIAHAPRHLHRGGWLVLEISPMIADQVARIVDESGQFEKAQLRKDLAGRIRVVVARRAD